LAASPNSNHHCLCMASPERNPPASTGLFSGVFSFVSRELECFVANATGRITPEVSHPSSTTKLFVHEPTAPSRTQIFRQLHAGSWGRNHRPGLSAPTGMVEKKLRGRMKEPGENELRREMIDVPQHLIDHIPRDIPIRNPSHTSNDA
jgi:hypothetical protein